MKQACLRAESPTALSLCQQPSVLPPPAAGWSAAMDVSELTGARVNTPLSQSTDSTCISQLARHIQSACQQKIPARNVICAHVQDCGEWWVAASDPESIYYTTTELPTDKRFSCVLMNSVWFNVEHYHNTHSTEYRCTHYTLLLTARCFQSVCSSVTPWCVILLSTNSSPLVHPTVHFPPETHQSPPAGTFSWNADCCCKADRQQLRQSVTQ
jgi:hypothetical protein